MYVPSSPGDEGLAVGGGWHVVAPRAASSMSGREQQQQQKQKEENNDDGNITNRNIINNTSIDGERQDLAYLGLPLFDLDSLPELATQRGAVAANTSIVASLLVEGFVGAIVRGRQEVGPRALGHRSLVSVPTSIDMRNRMNAIKSRQWYVCEKEMIQHE